MKICPQCNVAYQDDYVFCLSDGNSLIDESGEQETRLVSRIVFPERTSALSPDMLVACESCGLANRAKSKFCKKCGVVLEDLSRQDPVAQSVENGVFGFEIFTGAKHLPPPDSAVPIGSEQTVQFQPGRFTPPQIQTPVAGSNQPGRQVNIAIIAILIVLITVIAALVYNSGSNNSQASSNSKMSNIGNNRSSGSNGTNTSGNVKTNSAGATVSSDSRIGRIGRLTTNAHIRSTSYRDAEDLGVHYEGARVRILDVHEYSTNNDYAIWFRVNVIENGCDKKENLGCGNDLFGQRGAAAMEGWMSARNIELE